MTLPQDQPRLLLELSERLGVAAHRSLAARGVARQAAANILAALEGAPTRAFAHKTRGSMAAIGHLKGVADLLGIPLSGLPAWLLWRAYDLAQMPTFGRKLRIFVEWTWGMFFPTDITHLRFTRSRDVDPLPAEAACGTTLSVARAIERAAS